MAKIKNTLEIKVLACLTVSGHAPNERMDRVLGYFFQD